MMPVQHFQPNPKRIDPYTPRELLDMREAGDTVSIILDRARRVNGWDRKRVRGILFNEQ